MTNDYRRGSDGGRGSGRPSSRGRSGYQGTGRQSYNAGQSRGNDPASRLRGSGGPQVHNTRSRKSSSTEWLTGAPLPRRKAVMGFIGLGLGLGVFRLADYQIVEADKLRERADARRLLAQTLYAKRGTIYDRNGNVLASSVECRNIAVNPQLVDDVDKTVSALVKATGIDKKTCRKLVESDGTWVYIKRQVDEDDAAALEKKNLPGVLFEQAMKRVYPYGNLASQVLGVVNVDNDGLTGLEKQYNKLLTGTNGSLVRERARDGSYIAGGAYRKVAAVDGVDIVTTLDVNIQRAAEDALAEAVEKTKAKNGSALVTDPTTGEILAACSYPTYDQTDLENAKTEDMNLRLVEGINGDSPKEEILAILSKYGISETEVTLWGTGTPLREFLWSEEMADASVFVMEHVDFKDTYKEGSKDIRNCHINIGTGKEITIRQLAERIVETVGYQGKLTFDSSKPDGTMRKLTDPSKLHALGWHHKIEIEEGVRKMYEWYLK